MNIFLLQSLQNGVQSDPISYPNLTVGCLICLSLSLFCFLFFFFVFFLFCFVLFLFLYIYMYIFIYLFCHFVSVVSFVSLPMQPLGQQFQLPQEPAETPFVFFSTPGDAKIQKEEFPLATLFENDRSKPNLGGVGREREVSSGFWGLCSKISRFSLLPHLLNGWHSQKQYAMKILCFEGLCVSSLKTLANSMQK